MSFITIAGVYALPPIVAILVSRWAKSQFVRHSVYSVAVFCLIAYAIMQVAQLNCGYNDFKFVRCATLPDVLALMVSYFHIFYSIAYLIGGPIFLAFAAIVEMVVRSKV